MNPPVIAFAGSPNCGKTALFNTITGSKQKVANYPGVTVEKKFADYSTATGKKVVFVDLPGTYSLDPQTPDEQVTLDVLLNKNADQRTPDLIVAVADATNLSRTLSLTLELLHLKRPVILALNMMDLALKRGLVIDLKALQMELGIPVIATVAVKKSGTYELLKIIDSTLTGFKLEEQRKAAVGFVAPPSDSVEIENRFKRIDQIISSTTKRKITPHYLTAQIDRVVLHPLWGSLILIATMFLIFQGVFTWAGPPQDLIARGVGALGTYVNGMLGDTTLRSLVVDGVIAGVGAVLVFLPQILLLFFFVLMLEGTGYMARAAFIMDRMMSMFGLHGRAFIPLLSSFACAIPGIMATRTIKNPKDRLITILVAPLMTCSARLPVYVLIISAFIPNTEIFGPVRLQGLVMFALFIGGIFSAIFMAFLLKKTILKGPKPPFVLELPTYKLPALTNVLHGLKTRAMFFIKRAGTVIFALSVILWILSSFPKAPENADRPAIHYSFAGIIGHAMEPAVRPLGFDWRIATGLIPGFAAREVMVGALGTVFAIEGKNDVETEKALSEKIRAVWTVPTALSLLVWYIFAPQCISTLAVTRRETNSWRWPAFMLVYMTALAYLFAFITYQIATRLV